ncbi:MAG: IS21-like element helper ATPase IstB [Kiritimatiellia bacterium]
MKTVDMLSNLKLLYPLENFENLTREAGLQSWSHQTYLDRLIEGECQRRDAAAASRRVKNARFPVPKGLENFAWSWPKKINRAQIQDLFRMAFMEQQTNVVFIGGVGLGKTHLATALGMQACEQGHSTLFVTAVDIVNTLAAAQQAHRLRQELNRYARPDLLIVDELGYLPIDKLGADLLFQVFSKRYELGSTVITTNKPYKHWSSIFNNDATLASAVLDRILHHAETVVIEGPSYRMKDRVVEP